MNQEGLITGARGLAGLIRTSVPNLGGHEDKELVDLSKDYQKILTGITCLESLKSGIKLATGEGSNELNKAGMIICDMHGGTSGEGGQQRPDIQEGRTR